MYRTASADQLYAALLDVARAFQPGDCDCELGSSRFQVEHAADREDAAQRIFHHWLAGDLYWAVHLDGRHCVIGPPG